MIKPVDDSNLITWATLCTMLWPDHRIQDILSMRSEDYLQHEYLYYQDEEVLGFISLSLRHDYVEGTTSSPVGYVEGLYVLEEYRSQGIARELIEFAKQWTAEQGASELASDVELDNQLSQQFHEAIGFKEVGRIVCYTMRVK